MSPRANRTPTPSDLSRRALVTGGATAALALTAPPGRALGADGTAGVPAPYGIAIPSAFPFVKKRIAVEGGEIAYVDEGDGQPVLFLHGNPTSSYLWRNIIPHVTDGYRAIAPDLIGMGDSSKPDIAYTFADHARYLDAFIAALGIEEVVLVVHDWGSALGMRYARLNPDRVAALVFMEAIIPPTFPQPSYEAMGPEMGGLFRDLRTPGVGEKLVLEENFFVEVILPRIGTLRPLGEAEMAAYRAPYPTPESRRPLLQWPREIPIGGEPAAATADVVANGAWLAETDLPKLMFHAAPGVLAPPPVAEALATSLPNFETRFVGAGAHFIQEDQPEVIGLGLRDWLRRV